MKGEGGPTDVEGGRVELDKAFELGGCEDASLWADGLLGRSTHCCRLGSECKAGCEGACGRAVKTIQARVIAPLRRLCGRGDPIACHVVATALTFGGYRDGIGRLVEQDASSKAGPMFEVACNGGLALGCLALASEVLRRWEEAFPPKKRYAEPAVSPPPAAVIDRVKALNDRACRLGAAPGCVAVGRAFERAGKNREAFGWYERACKVGMPAVCNDLAEWSTLNVTGKSP